MRESYGPQTKQIEAFLTRLKELPFAKLGEAVTTWRGEVADSRWHESEDQLGEAITDTGRFAERERVLERLYDVFRRSTWFTAHNPDDRIPGSDASAQYVVTIALFALLVCDRLSAADFDVLYEPFARLIPAAELESEQGAAETHWRRPNDSPSSAKRAR